MTVFTKKELHTQINNVDTRIALLKLPTVSKEESEKIETELQELNAARNELLEKMKVVPEWRRIADAVPWAEVTRAQNEINQYHTRSLHHS